MSFSTYDDDEVIGDAPGFSTGEDDEEVTGPVASIYKTAYSRGVNPDFLVGLAKLETRMGEATIKGDSDSYNLFNIKDFSGKGPRATDKAEGSRDAYRQYASYDDSANDLVDLLERKYPKALEAQTPEQFATALKQGGYATDPDYVNKIVRTINSVRREAQPSQQSTDDAGMPNHVNLRALDAQMDARSAQPEPQKKAPSTERTWREVATDTGRSLTQGAIDVLGVMPGTLYAAATGNYDNALLKTARGMNEIIQEDKSAGIKARQAEMDKKLSNAEGFTEKIVAGFVEGLADPTLLADTLARSVPGMVAGGGLGRVAGTAADAIGMTALKTAAAQPGIISQGLTVASAAPRVAGATAVGTSALVQGSSVASDTYEEAMKRPMDDFRAQPEFAQLAQEHGEEQAKSILAGKAATRAGMAATAASLVAQKALPGGDSIEKMFLPSTMREVAEDVAKVGSSVLTKPVTKGMAGGVASQAAELGLQGVKTGLKEGFSEAAEEGFGAVSKDLEMSRLGKDVDIGESFATAAGQAAAAGVAMGHVAGMRETAATKAESIAAEGARLREMAAQRQADITKAGSVDEAIKAATDAQDFTSQSIANQILQLEHQETTKRPAPVEELPQATTQPQPTQLETAPTPESVQPGPTFDASSLPILQQERLQNGTQADQTIQAKPQEAPAETGLRAEMARMLQAKGLEYSSPSLETQRINEEQATARAVRERDAQLRQLGEQANSGFAAYDHPIGQPPAAIPIEQGNAIKLANAQEAGAQFQNLPNQPAYKYGSLEAQRAAEGVAPTEQTTIVSKTDAVSHPWTAMDAGAKETALIQAGFVTKQGELSPPGRKLMASNWDAISEKTRLRIDDALQRQALQQPPITPSSPDGVSASGVSGLATHTKPAPYVSELNNVVPLKQPDAVVSADVARAAASIPTFQGGKTKMARAITGQIAQHFGENAKKIDTVIDYFGGSGSWGGYMAQATFPNVKNLIVHEYNPERLAKIKLFNDAGNKVSEYLQHPAVAAYFDSVAKNLQVKGTFSGSSIANAIKDRNAKATTAMAAIGEDAFQGLRQAVEDQGQASFGMYGKGESGSSAVADMLRRVSTNANQAYQQMQKLRDRGVNISYVTGDSYKAAQIPGKNVLAIVDPPYYATKGYNGVDIVPIETYNETRKLLGRLKDAGNSVIYTDEAWWEKHDKKSGATVVPADVAKQVDGLDGFGQLNGIRSTMGDFFRMPIATRMEVVGFLDGNKNGNQGIVGHTPGVDAGQTAGGGTQQNAGGMAPGSVQRTDSDMAQGALRLDDAIPTGRAPGLGRRRIVEQSDAVQTPPSSGVSTSAHGTIEAAHAHIDSDATLNTLEKAKARAALRKGDIEPGDILPKVQESAPVQTATGRDGYDTPVQVDAKRLMTILESTRGESIVDKPAKLEAWRNGTAKTDPVKSPIEIGFNSSGKLDVNDGRHRIALAAERGEKVSAFIDRNDVGRLYELLPDTQRNGNEVNDVDRNQGVMFSKDAPTPTEPPLTTRQTVRDAIAESLPKQARAIDRMIQRGDEGKRGGLVVIESNTPEAIAKAYSEKTGRDYDAALVQVQKSADGKIQGFHDPQSGLSFVVAPNVTKATAAPVALHEAYHGQQRDAIDTKAQALLDSADDKLHTKATREVLLEARQKITDASETGNKKEAAAYIIEAAAQRGREAGFSAVDGKFMDWVDKHIGVRVGGIIRDFVSMVRAHSLRIGLPINLHVDDLVAYAKIGLERAAEGKTLAGNGDVRQSFAGTKAATADTHALTTAQDRIATGADAEAVRKETGWFKGADGKWRFEINDRDAKIGTAFANESQDTDTINNRLLPGVLWHDRLYAAYPALRKYRVNWERGENISGNIYVDGQTINVKAPTLADTLSVLLHETQHGIQTIEGFASGGSPGQQRKYALEQTRKIMEKEYGHLPSYKKAKDAGTLDEWVINAAQSTGLGVTPAQAYQRLAGEVEARNVQTRQFMTDERRREQSPESTADVKASDVIVVFNGKEMHSAPPPANTPPQQQQPAAPQPTWDYKGSKADKLIYELQDGRIDLKRVQESIKRSGQAINEKFDARLAETLYAGRVATRTDRFLKDDAAPLLEQMARTKVTTDELSDYLLARHAPERNAQIAKVNDKMPDGGAGTNSQGVRMTTQAAKDYIANLPTETRLKMEALAQKVDAITKGTRDLLVSEGLEKQETIDAWNGAYKHYAPLFREDVDDGRPHSVGTGFSVRGDASKRATGSDKKVDNMLAHVLMQREAAITRAEKNRVAMSLYGLALSSPNKGFWTTITPTTKKAQIMSELVAMGVDPVVAEQGMEGIPTTRTVDKVTGKVVDRINPLYKSLPGAITVRVNGEDRVLMLNQKDENALRMAENLKNLDGLTKFDLASTIVGKSTRWISAANTQYNPAFGMVNTTRDSLGALVNLSTTPLKGKQLQVFGNMGHATQGIYSALRGDTSGQWAQLYEQFQMDGGQTGYKEMFKDVDARAKAIEKQLASYDKSAISPGKAAHAVLSVLDGFNTIGENVVRLSAYKAALDNGMSRPEAAKLARELTVDFNRKGRMGRELGPLYAFFNASVQGTARTLTSLKGPAGAKIIAGGIGLGMLQAVMLAAAGYDDDEIPDWVKSRNLVVPLGKADKGEKKYFLIPLPAGLNALPNIGRTIAELGRSGGKDFGKKTVSAIGEVIGALNPVGGGTVYTPEGGVDWGGVIKTVTPTILDPVVELATNKGFSGQAIEKTYRDEADKRPGFQRAKEKTQRTPTGQMYIGITKALNRMTGGSDYEAGFVSPSPEKARYLAEAIGGGLLREIEKAVDLSVKVPGQKEAKPSGVPFIGRFYGETDSDAVTQQRYYKSMDKVKSVKSSIDLAKAAGDRQAVERLYKTQPEAKLIDLGNRVQSHLSKLNKLAVSQLNNPENVKAVDEARLKLMRATNQKILEMEAQ